MTYLNDRVLVTVSDIRGAGKSFLYKVKCTANGETTTIFTGNVFVPDERDSDGKVNKTFDITDIALNYKWVPKPEELKNTVSRVGEVLLKAVFTVEIYDYSNLNYPQSDGTSDDIVLCYKYPHLINRMFEYCWLDDDALNVELQGRREDGTFELTPRYPLIETDKYHFQVVTNSVDSDIINIKPQDGYTTSFEIEDSTVNHVIVALDELLYKSEKTRLPYTTGERDNVGKFDGVNKWTNFPPAVGLSSSIQYELYMPTYGQYRKGTLNEGAILTIPVVIDDSMEKGILRGESIILNFVNGTNGMFYANLYLDTKDFRAGSLEGKTMNFSLGYVAGNGYYLICNIIMSDIWNPNTCIYVSDEKAALLDECPAPYYLQWQDRLGSFQSQPFNGKIKFSESFDRLETLNYFEKSKLSGVNTTAKWRIYSKFIPENLYPYYESIFTSPYLILYDTENDVTYEVKCTGDWAEKYYREGRQMISLELDLEEVVKQKNIF